MSKRVVILLGFLVLLVETLQAQPYHYSLRNYKAVDGLPQSQVRFMVEDKNGYLWIGTEGGGLARFDGRNFHVYTTLDGLQSNIVTSLFIDSKQNLWIVHPRGLTRFDGMEFRRFEKAGSRQSTTKLRRVLEYQDTIFFFSSPGYMGKIYGDSIYYWSKPIAERKEGQHEPLITFARQFGKAILFCMNNKSFYCRTPQENFWIRFDNQFNYIKKTFDYKGQLWMATDSGYFSVDLKGRTIKREELPVKNAIIQYDSIHDVFYTRNVTSFHKETIKDGTVKIDTVFRDIEVDQVLVDSEGNTWFGSNGNGLYKYFVQDFDHCGSEKMRNVMAIFRDRDGAIWIGTHNRGVYRIKKGKIRRYSFPADATKNSVFSIAQDPEGTIWIGGGGGLGKYNNVKDEFEWPAFQSGPWRPSIVSIQFDDKGAMWVGTVGGGVYRMTGNQVSNFSVDNGLETNMVMSLLYSPFYKKVFVGDEFGLSSITNNTAARINIPGLDNTTIISMSQYKDSVLLLSTAGAGLIIYNPHSQFKKFITTKEGLASDFIYFGAADNDGYFWVGTEKGITRIRFDQYFNVEDHIHFDYENGLTGVEANQNAYCFSDGNKYFGLIDGLYQYNDPERIVTKVFDLHLTQIQLLYGEEPITEYCDYATGFFHIPVNLVLPPDKNHITFHFNRVWKSNPKSIKFKYFLQGFDKTWSLPSSISQVTYSNLPPGEYTFLVMSTDNVGGWKQPPVAYTFTIRMPFYTRTSFIIGCIIFFALFILMILYIRVRQRVNRVMFMERIRMKEQESVRKDIARDFHDEMGNQLTRIINYVSLLKMNGKSGANHEDLYRKVEESAKYLFNGTRDFIWSIDPGNDELSKLFLHIRDFGEKLFEEKGISFRAINEVKEKIKLPYGFSREANLIFKEAMTNAFKYSKAKNVTFSLKSSEDSFEMCLEDDGIGYDSSQVEKQGGLKNITERAQRINAKLNIQSVPERGTKVVINFKNTKTLEYGIAI